MKKPIFVLIQILLVLALPFVPVVNVFAQNAWDISVNLISTVETPDFMTLKVYFTISDGHAGTPIVNPKISTAQVALLNQNFIANATVKKPDIPIYIAIVMDSSGSMGGSVNDLKNSAKLSLSDIPDDSYFSVVQFDESTRILQDFTKNISAVSYAIDQYKVSNKGTCLYDAAYTMVETMSQRSDGRRAVILFTDGKDENMYGQPCSQHKYQELIDLAMKSQVPINTIGLSTKEANINAVELQAMAASTGGFSAIASKDDLPAAFSRIMTALKAQWMAEAIIYPKNGNNNAVLTLTTSDNKSLNTAFVISSGRDYPGPASPVTVKLAGLMLNAVKQSYELQLDVASPNLVQYVKIEVWDKDGGSKVGEYIFKDPSDANTFLIPTEPLSIDRSYELRISAISRADNSPFPIIRDDQGRTSTVFVHEFKFDPSSAYPNLQVQSVLQKGGDLLLNVSLTNPGLVGGFDGWLVNPDSNTQVSGSNFTSLPLDNTSGTITIPMRSNKIPSGKYNVVLRTLAKNNSVFTTTTVEQVVYKAPSIFVRIGSALIAQPIYLIAVVGIIFAVIVFLMVLSARQKTMTGTPVLQGRIGGRSGGRRGQSGPVIPVSDFEPIPFRPTGQPGQPPVMPQPTPPQFGVPPIQAQPVPPPQQYTPQPVVPPQPYSPQPVMPPQPYAAQPQVPQPVPPQVAPPQPVAPSSIPANPPETPASPEYVFETVMQGVDSTIVGASRSHVAAYLNVTNFPVEIGTNGRVLLDQFPFIVGRTEGNLLVSAPSVSRRHLQVTFDPSSQAYFVTDLNSSNGTTVNGQRITPLQPMRLENGALLGLGPSVIIKFELS